MNLRQQIASYYHYSPEKWELLATAIGVEEAVKVTTDGLRGAELHKKVGGKASFPSVIRERVDALAAYNPQLLAQLAQQWLVPSAIQNDHWWTAAWHPSLRHLKQLGVIQRDQVNVPALRHEVDILWYDADPSPISWKALQREFDHAGGRDFDMMRMVSSRQLSDTTLSVQDITSVPFYRLRSLRGKTEKLDKSARDWLQDMGRTGAQGDFAGAVYVLELCKELSLPVEAELEVRIARQIPQLDLTSIASTIYVLFTNWRIP
jgi:hypothetical protein